jgi:polyhydroxybutyrate depolymerase
VKKLVADGLADAKRIEVTGMCNGAIMSFRLVCGNPDLIVGAAPVAANMPVPAGCNRTSRLALFNIVGTDDTFVPTAGGAILGRARQGQVISSAETLVLFQHLSTCHGVPKVSVIDRAPEDGTSLHISEAQGCAAPITQVQVAAGGNGWPGKESPIDWITGVNSRGINATTALIDFFAGLESQP